ncbi:MAG: site-2 protease family protein [Candidatus Wildermuthbacteria bacterium]|nr:site-2 protease family protein [Candidatus Wildermuthbacteria bacterium]
MTIFIALLSIGILVILHELGHFFAAKKFGIKVEEFGIGLPPRLFGKKYGETIYSVNALPIGGFVRMEGEEKRSDSPDSFSKKPLWQRFCVVAAGVVVFWVVAVVIFTLLGATTGIPTALNDEQEDVINPHVRVIGIAADSPAASAGLKIGDTITYVAGQAVSTVREVQELSAAHTGEEVLLNVQRGEKTLELSLVPRETPPAGEGPIGIALTRAGFVRYAWYEAPWQGLVRTWHITTSIFATFGTLISQVTGGKGLPAGTQVSGPVGVVDLLKNSLALGVSSFLSFVAIISVYLAIFNTLPIPALDGGRMFFLLLEGIRRKPLSEKLEQRLILISFLVLIPFILWVTVNDIRRLF